MYIGNRVKYNKVEVNKAVEDMRLEENETDNVEELWRKFKSGVLLSLKKTPRIDRLNDLLNL